MLRTTLILSFLLVSPAVAQEHVHKGSAPEKLGTVHFKTSCNADAQRAIDRAVALLHSFEFSRAIAGFNETLSADPRCAIAQWGIALSRWSNPMAAGIRPPAQVQSGRDAIERARATSGGSDRERTYIDAVAKLYLDADRVPQHARVAAYRDAMAALSARYPDDPEAKIFYAIAVTAAAAPTDKTYADQLKAGAILEEMFARQPDHPGLAHYIIHTYDYPPLAGRALEAARQYAKIAPSAPHALHMPSHAFTRVGYWQESIDTNIASAEAARRDGSTGEELHAADYQMYAYLQTGQDEAAARLLRALPAVAARFDPKAIGGAAPGSAGVFALAAIPARYALERGDWKAAATLEPHASAFPYAEAITWFAQALGAAHLNDVATARTALDALQSIRDRLAQANESYWAEQVEIERRGAAAWTAFAERRVDEALREMRTAAEREDATEKSAVTPGPLAPARELLGEMLLASNRPAEALKEFETTLTREPNRFRALAGAAKAADAAGNRAAARRYYEQLVKVCARADKPGRPELQEARRAR
jgi:hypothetical protein